MRRVLGAAVLLFAAWGTADDNEYINANAVQSPAGTEGGLSVEIRAVGMFSEGVSVEIKQNSTTYTLNSSRFVFRHARTRRTQSHNRIHRYAAIQVTNNEWPRVKCSIDGQSQSVEKGSTATLTEPFTSKSLQRHLQQQSQT